MPANFDSRLSQPFSPGISHTQQAPPSFYPHSSKSSTLTSMPPVKKNGAFAGGLRASAHAPDVNGNYPVNTPRAYHQNNVVQQNGVYYGQFNPAQASFQPAGIEVLRYEAPRIVNVPLHHDQLVEMVANHNIQQLTESSRLDSQTRGLARDVIELRHIFANDLKKLEKRIAAVQNGDTSNLPQKQIEASGPVQKVGADLEAEYNYYSTSPDFSVSAEMLKTHPKEQIASSYLDEAERREDCALLLRGKALELCPDLLEEQPTVRLQIESAPVAVAQAAITGFACCHTEYSSFEEMSEHVKKMHFTPEQPISRGRSKAVEIKAPQEMAPASVDVQRYETTIETTKREFSPWKPAGVTSMPPPIRGIPENAETFSFEFIRTTFSGSFWSPGFYFIPKGSKIPSKSYWILDLTHEPFLPTSPGQHGAKLTAFFNETVSGAGKAPEEENYQDVPVFVKASAKDEYSYFGNYSQLRFSDKLGYDTIAQNIPESVLRFHAEQLAETGRPDWVTKALKKHFWPQPTYEGPIPTDSALNSPTTSVGNGNEATTGLERRVLQALTEYAAELKEWKKTSNLTVSLLTSESIFKAFSSPDTDLEPGLRLYWEYLQCVGWDAGFYKMLVGLKASPVTKLQIGSSGSKRTPSPVRPRDGSTAAKKGLTVEATYKVGKKAKESMVVHPGPNATTEFVEVDFEGKRMGMETAKKVEPKINGSAQAGPEKPKMAPKTNGVPPKGPKGDLTAANKESAKVAKVGGYLPPHMRARK